MILRRFNLDEIDNCKTVGDVFRMMGVAVGKDDPQDLKITDESVFGKKAYYANMVMNDNTYQKIYAHLNKVNDKAGNRFATEAFQWMNYSPLSSGPKYDKIKEETGAVSEDVLYIITPEDSLYEPEPTTVTAN